MPFRKVRSLSELEHATWHEPGEQLWAAIDQAWGFAASVTPRKFPPGVYRHRSLQDAQAQREEWDRQDFERYWERQRALGMKDPRQG